MLLCKLNKKTYFRKIIIDDIFCFWKKIIFLIFLFSFFHTKGFDSRRYATNRNMAVIFTLKNISTGDYHNVRSQC